MRLAPYAVGIGNVTSVFVLTAPAISALSPQGGGLIFGWVYGFTWDNQLVPLAWVQVTASNPNALSKCAIHYLDWGKWSI